ncbi:protein-export membrane protein SecD [Candidatus Campbellbacteria bacterium RIFCSPHIGHO2_12_FULL_35_10]|uniref:Protein translocase subunit SecD n=1 Tax=Candidatus Campbellbacteria bacterium RIFCSPHIGHO2_12_FULL_35_10 TaxID=1797578 RepID=A0A1F5EMH4_9BACT|nr:MAG: protein-export membrane protein SecD [Candidatus Campbellbacteria bacterium RIFCSPHIGHO2_12_FULL_35_10]
MKIRIIAIMLLLVGGLIGYFNYNSQVDLTSKFPFKLGLDLAGGTQLTYQADISNLSADNIGESMSALRDVIERRTNLFGVSEPLVQVEKAGEDYRLIVELPGVTDINQAVTLIGQTPLLEFKKEKDNTQEILNAQMVTFEALQNGDANITPDPLASEDPYQSTGLTGRYLENAQLIFNSQTGEPTVLLTFNAEGKEMFAQITKENLNKVIAIYLDGQPITTPVVRSEIRDGKAEISGGFTPEEAKELVRNLNYGALPVPIELISTQTVGASLGEDVLNKGIFAGIYGLIAVSLFLIIWYRLPGLLSVIALMMYVTIVLALFKLIPVTLTSAGIAGFILSIGMAVDANILVFERIKEELRKGMDIESATREGFSRAWLSIRDSNTSSIITGIILFWFGTSLVKGFALTFIVGVVVSMFTALTVSRTFLLAVSPSGRGKISSFLFSCGITR